MILTFTANPAVDKTLFVDHIDPGGKHRNTRYTCVPGGKGCNVSRVVKTLGYDTAAMIIAAGHTGRHVVDMITQDDGVRAVPFWTDGMTRTITTVLEEATHRQSAFFEPGPTLTPAQIDRLVDTYRAAVAGVPVATFNGAVQHHSLRTLYCRLIAAAHEAGARCILDSYGAEFAEALEAGPYMVKPNVQEAAGVAGFPLTTREDQWRAVEFFHQRGVRLVVLSLGAEGALVSCNGQRYHAVPPAITEVNPVGSGDALVAGFAVGVQEGWDLARMTRLACAAGTANAMSWDIGHFKPVTVQELAARVTLHPG
ncbi:MAG: 1-phosphofructokinase family hexose kinase [Candidatus Hydrogenedentota bacterium]